MIDDSSLALEVQVMMFERRGYEVRGCTDLEEMREAASNFTPDVVVTDVGLADAKRLGPTFPSCCSPAKKTTHSRRLSRSSGPTPG